MLDSGKADRPLLNRPELFPDLGQVWAAWRALDATRGAGMAEPNRIDVSQCREWCDLVGIHDADDRLDLFAKIQVLENAYFKHYRKEHAKK